MPLAIVQSRAQLGVFALPVSVEVHLSAGLPGFTIVGLPEAAVRESRERVRAAILNSNLEFPMRRITVNLAPADLPKDGGRFDLPIAIGLLCASGQLKTDRLTKLELIGELGLGGELKPVGGMLPAVIAAGKMGCSCLIPAANQSELEFLQNQRIICAGHLIEACGHISGTQPLAYMRPVSPQRKSSQGELDFRDVIGQTQAKRALEVAAAGGHHVLMIGPPGSGKTMLATRFPGILPAFTEDEMIESSVIHSISFGGKQGICETQHSRPFRAPHHSISSVALAGGGSIPKPGEISLAHNGVLFLDELSEFDRRALEIMREPLESGAITISRATQTVDYPARFQLIAAMNPCPNGCEPDRYGHCNCSAVEIRRYRSRISTPLLDRIDIQLSIPKLDHTQLIQPRESASCLDTESSQSIQQRVQAARLIQMNRQSSCNQQLTVRNLQRICKLDRDCRQFLTDAFQALQLTARSYHRTLKVARTLSDLAGSEQIKLEHVAEAVSYRGFDQLLNKDRS